MGTLSQLFVNGIQLDLLPDTVIAVTIQGYNPLIPDQVKYSFTNRITVPITVNNRNALNYLDNLATLSSFYKQRQPARYVQNGMEIIPDGYVLVLGIKENFFELAIYAGFLDLFAQLNDKLLIDVDMETDVPCNSNWTPAVWDTKRYDKVVDGTYGAFSSVGHVVPAVINLVGSNNLAYAAPNITVNPAPIIYGYKVLLERIFRQAGYTFDFGTLCNASVADGKFLSMAVLQGSNNMSIFRYDNKYISDNLEFAATKSADQVIVNPGLGVATVISFDLDMIKCTNWESSTANNYTVAQNIGGGVVFAGINFDCHLSITVSAAATCDIQMRKNGVSIHTISLVAGTTVVDLTSLTTGGGGDIRFTDSFFIQLVSTTAAGTFTVKKGGTFSNTFKSYGGLTGANYCLMNLMLPDILQLDFVKDFLFRFGQIPKQLNKKLTFRHLTEIINDQANVNDWTGKRDKTKFDEVTFSLTDLAQSNQFLYNILDQDVLSTEFGAGYFALDDLSLEKLQSTSSIWDGTDDSVTIPAGAPIGVECAQVPTGALTLSLYYDNDLGKRLLCARANDANDAPTVSYNGVNRATYYVATFLRSEATSGYPSLSFQSILDEKYSNAFTGGSASTGFLARLKNAKWVIRYYNLNDVDIATLDPHKMILDSGQYFLFPKIFNYVPGAITKVQMLKI